MLRQQEGAGVWMGQSYIKACPVSPEYGGEQNKNAECGLVCVELLFPCEQQKWSGLRWHVQDAGEDLLTGAGHLSDAAAHLIVPHQHSTTNLPHTPPSLSPVYLDWHWVV